MKLKAFVVILMVVLSAIPAALAEENQTTVPKGKAYGFIESIGDRIALWFAWKDEQKLTVMNRIQERREAHYQFLMSNNKTEQANKFRERTLALVQNFEQQRVKIQERLQMRLQNMNETQKSVQEAIQERIQEQKQIRNESLRK